jgi:hypothetical protein
LKSKSKLRSGAFDQGRESLLDGDSESAPVVRV